MIDKASDVRAAVTVSALLRDFGYDVRGHACDSPVTGKARKISVYGRDTRWTDFSVPSNENTSGFAGGSVIDLYCHITGCAIGEAIEALWRTYCHGTDAISTTRHHVEKAKATNEAPTLSKEELDAAYKIFLNLCTLDGKGEQYLHETRRLTDAEIERIGFKTFPTNEICKVLTKQLRASGIDPDSVPGLYTWKGKTVCSFDERDALIIPVRDADGLIAGLQLRMFDPEAALRYCWFSSSSMTSDKCVHDGKSSGSPVCFITGSTNFKTAFITEGVFKALAFRKQFGCPGFAVQGVGNLKGIDYAIARMLSQYEKIQRIIIAYDADFICKMPVAQQAVRLYDLLATTFPQLKVDYLLWDASFGKGIDDLINSRPHAERLVKTIPMDCFKKAFDEFHIRGMEMAMARQPENEIGTAFKAVLDKYNPAQ